MAQINREARDGLMRAWLEVLRQRHPQVSWVPAEAKDGQRKRKPADKKALSVSA